MGRIDLIDTARAVATLAGIALVGYGAWLHYHPLGYIVGGALLGTVGFVASLRAR